MNKLLIIIILVCNIAHAATNNCDLALEACKDLVTAQDTQITHLKDAVKQLEGKVEQDTNPLIPWWGWAIIGGVVGGFLIHEVER